MVDVSVDISDALRGLNDIEEGARRANDAAVQAAARFALARVQSRISVPYGAGQKAPIGQLGRRTGRLFAETQIKSFRLRSGLRGASVQVIGERKFIMGFNEEGTKSHGRVRGWKPFQRSLSMRTVRRSAAVKFGTSALPARKVYAQTWQAIESSVVAIYQDTFERRFPKIK